MDPQALTRWSMAGWIFVAVVLGSVADRHGTHWTAIVNAASQSNSILALAYAAVVGIGAPPALGFIFARIVARLAALGRLVRNPEPENSAAVSYLRTLLPPGVEATASDASIAAMLVHSLETATFADWVQRRVTQTYASASSALAAVAGVGFVLVALPRDVDVMVSLTAVLVALALAADAVFETRAQLRAVRAWHATVAILALRAAYGPPAADSAHVPAAAAVE